MQSVSGCWDKLLANKQSLRPVAAVVAITRDEVRKQFVFTLACLFSCIIWPNLVKTPLVFDCTHKLGLTLSRSFCCFPWIQSCGATTYGNTSKSSKNTPCLPGGNQEVVCRDLQPLMICCSAVDARHSKGRIQTIAPGVNGKRRRRASTNARLLFRDLYKCMRHNQRHCEAAQMTACVTLITT